MTTLAQFWFITAYPDKSHVFDENNEEFEEFRDDLLIMKGMSAEKLDSPISLDKSKVKDKKVSPGTIYRRSHDAIRSAIIRGKLSLINIQRFLLTELYNYSQQLEEAVDDELVTEWKSQIEPHLKNLDTKSRFETLLGVFAKVLTLSATGKTMQSYLKAGKKDEVKDNVEETDDSDDDNSFQIPKL